MRDDKLGLATGDARAGSCLFTFAATLFGVIREKFREGVTDCDTEHDTRLAHTLRP